MQFVPSATQRRRSRTSTATRQHRRAALRPSRTLCTPGFCCYSPGHHPAPPQTAGCPGASPASGGRPARPACSLLIVHLPKCLLRRTPSLRQPRQGSLSALALQGAAPRPSRSSPSALKPPASCPRPPGTPCQPSRHSLAQTSHSSWPRIQLAAALCASTTRLLAPS